MSRPASAAAGLAGTLSQQQSVSFAACQEQDEEPAGDAAAASNSAGAAGPAVQCVGEAEGRSDAQDSLLAPGPDPLQLQQERAAVLQTSNCADSRQRPQSAVQSRGRVRTSRVGFAGVSEDAGSLQQPQLQQQCDASIAVNQEQAVQPTPVFWQQAAEEQQHAVGALGDDDDDAEPAVAEDDIPSSLWLPEFVGRKAAHVAAHRQPQQLLKAGQYRSSIAAQMRPSSAAAGQGIGSARAGSSGRCSLFEGPGCSSASTARPGRPVGRLLQSKERPSSAAPRLQH